MEKTDRHTVKERRLKNKGQGQCKWRDGQTNGKGKRTYGQTCTSKYKTEEEKNDHMRL